MLQKDKQTIQTISFFILLAVMLFLVGKLFLPYATVLLWSSVVYMLASPLYNKILSKMNKEKKTYIIKKSLLAGTFSIITVLIVAGILSFVVIKIFGQGRALAQNAVMFFEKINSPENENLKQTIAAEVYRLSRGTIDISQLNLTKELLNLASISSDTILKSATNLVKNAGQFFLSLIFFAFSLYFFYIDGAYLAGLLRHAIPVDSETSGKIFAKIKEITANLFKGLFLVSFYQGLASFIIYILFGVQSALLLAILTFFTTFLPLVGCGVIWFPLGISMCFTHSPFKGILFLIIAGSVISLMDGFLRPFFLKDRIKIHPLLIFFSMLGGVKMFALNGIILGPMIVILFFTVLDMALETEEKKDTEILNEDLRSYV
ncbi:AI-2E family transporter [Treponema pedis]|uniref:AI-2E family transporter n=1 Tax=Treponema pedis TaxID=409322 RepID=A0A7S7AWG2_9SPIR|nr:AI-2E family transporter [Treponema pedis]QOW60649.1 AI-2E family transporter [Treponema pedis]QSI03922.1 AI-2E family transporter [Treponema pedis]